MLSRKEVNYSLICAVREGKLETARELINSYGLFYSAAWGRGYNLLRDAVENRHADVVRLLLASGSRVNSSSSVSPPLHLAVKNGNIQIVQMLLDKRASINCKNQFGETPLHVAIRKEKWKVIELLLKFGADVNAEDNSGRSLLYVAIKNGSLRTVDQLLQVVEQLLKNGADINCVCTSENGYSPLHLAAKNGSKELITLLVGKGANVDAKGEDCITPLHIAIKNRYIPIAEQLLNHGACINSSTLEGYTPLHFASELLDGEAVKLLLNRGANVNASTKNNLTPLHIAAKNGYMSIADNLLNHGACINSATLEEEYTPLHFASELGVVEFVKLLLNRGADANASTKDNLTPLHIAAKKGYISIAENLINHGANVMCLTSEDYTPLHFASEKRSKETVKLLLNKGADINSNTKDNLTPLYIATNSGHEAIVKLLLQHGANVDNQDKDGKTILHVAVEKGRLMIIENILKYCPNINKQSNRSALKIAVHGYANQYKNIVMALEEYGFTVDFEDASDSKLLHVAIEKGYYKIVEELLKYGADVNTLNNSSSNENFTHLHVAAKNKQEDVAELLIKYKADINAQDKTGKTPIVYAIENDNLKITKLLLINGANIKDNPDLLNIAVGKESIEIVKALLQHGADVNAINEHGKTALHFTALEYKYSHCFHQSFYVHESDTNIKGKIAKLLLSKGANVDAKTNNCVTTLYAAAIRGFATVVKVLLEYNANPNIEVNTNHNSTPLQIAIVKGFKRIVKLLLQHGAKVDNEDKNGKTILHLAVEKGRLMIIENVLEYCPDINNQSNRSALKIAVHGYGDEYQNIVMALEEYGFTVDSEDASDSKLLHVATENGYLKIVEDLLKYGADVNMLHSIGYGKLLTPLHVAAKNKQNEVAELLVKYKADINAQDETGKTPIFYAIENDDLKITKLLLINGANIEDNPDLLNIAVGKESIEIVKALLQHGADVNASDEYGRTALYFSALFGNRQEVFHSTYTKYLVTNINGDIAKLLLKRGANIDAETEKGETALYVAIKNSSASVVEVLLEYNANLNLGVKHDTTLLHISVEKNNKEISTMLLNKGINVNAKQKDGKTALHIATQNGDQEIIESLLKFGADTNSRDKYGRTALHIAAKEGNVKVVETLLEHDSDINIMCTDKKTPLDFAIAAFKSYHSHQIAADKIIKHHIVKLKTANLYLSETNLLSISNSDEFLYFQSTCEREIERTKSEQIINANISFYNVLAKSSSSLARYLKNENIVQVLKAGEYKTKYPLYAGMIKSHFRRGMERNDLLKQFKNIFIFIFNNFRKLPYECTEEILSYLSNEELRIFIDACKTLSVQLRKDHQI